MSEKRRDLDLSFFSQEKQADCQTLFAKKDGDLLAIGLRLSVAGGHQGSSSSILDKKTGCLGDRSV